jgi:uncharacterized membrane protein
MMWEEHPEYQKAQTRLIGFLLLLLLIVTVISLAVAHDWDSLKQVLLFAGAFIIALGLVFGFVWLLVKIFTRKHADDTKIEDSHDD